VIPPSDAGNTVALAAVGPAVEATLGDLREAARRMKVATGLDLAPTLARLAKAHGESIAF